MSGTLEPFLREPAPGHGPVKTNLVQRRERSHGKGNSRPSFEADRKIDARSKTGKAPDGNTDMREPANESLLTDVSGFAPTVARSSHRSPLRSLWRGRAVAPSGLDMGHKSAERRASRGVSAFTRVLRRTMGRKALRSAPACRARCVHAPLTRQAHRVPMHPCACRRSAHPTIGAGTSSHPGANRAAGTGWLVRLGCLTM